MSKRCVDIPDDLYCDKEFRCPFLDDEDCGCRFYGMSLDIKSLGHKCVYEKCKECLKDG